MSVIAGGEFDNRLDDVDRNLAYFGHMWPKLRQIWPWSGKVGAISAKVGPSST